MRKALLLFGFFLLVGAWAPEAQAHQQVSLASLGLSEGDVVSAVGDPDIFIVNAKGHKRLILNPTIFSYYGHLTFRSVKELSSETITLLPTSLLFRNCESDDPKVHALDVIADDLGALRWVNISAEHAIAEDHDFFEKVFCINSREFGWYSQASAYDSLSQIPVYTRSTLPPPALNETNLPLVLPDGFAVSLFAETLGPVRFMAIAPDNILFVSMPSSMGLYGSGSTAKRDGKVFALPDRNQDGRADEMLSVLSGLDLPHGLAFFNGSLYVVEESEISRYPYLGNAALGAREVVVSGLPGGGGHVSRTLGFSPAGKMYVSIGSSCNSCVETDSRRASILEFNPNGSGERIFAQGLRNAVGFVFHPETGELWATENGRDYLGDNLPPDEVNIVRSGGHYGWPSCYGKNITDPAFGNSGFCATAQSSAYDIQAHSASLGLRFVQSNQFPSAWRGDLLVAYHGSWNRTEPTGYKVVRLDVEGNTIVREDDFISGWLRPDGAKLGRPVDVIFDNAGALYISDDKANVVYRVTKML